MTDKSESTAAHREAAAGQAVSCAVLTISDTRTKDDDKSGKFIIESLEADGHTVAAYDIVKDDAPAIDTALRGWLERSDVDAILTTGGTGIAQRDTTIEVVGRLIDKPLDGFGELFRMLSWDEVGSAAMLSRSAAGLAGEKLIFAMPGSSNAVKVAMQKLILPELRHLVWERRR